MKEKKSTFSWIFSFAGQKKSGYIASVILAVIGAAFQILPFFVMAQVIGKLLAGNKDLAGYLIDCAVMAAFWLLRVLFHSLSTAQSHKATFAVLGNIRKQGLAKLAKMPLGDVQAKGSGELKNILVERVDSIEPTLAHAIPEMSSNAAVALATLIYLFVIDWRMALASLITFPLGMVFFMLMMAGYEKNYARTVAATNTLNDTAVEYIGGIEVIKAFGKAKNSYEKFVIAAKECAQSYIDWMNKSNFYFTFAMNIMPATLLSVLPIGGLLLKNGTLTPEKFVLIVILSMGLITPIIGCMKFTDDLAKVGTIISQVTDILTAPELSRPETDTESPQGSTVELRDVHFGYNDAEVLHGIDLVFPEGTVNALVGPSGSGKSTIAKAQSAKEGNVPFHYKRFLGYRRGSDGKPEIDPEQAVTVKRIYERFLAGDSLATIASDLNADGIPTPSGVGQWQRGTIESILTNEKYKGDAVLNKTYIRDCLSKKVMINNGERPKYYVENNHPAIIDSGTFGRVQEEMARRSGKRKVKQVGTKTEQGRYSSKYALTELLICGECGTPYRRCTWAANGKKKVVWRCINRLDYGKKYCHDSPSIEESVLQEAIMKAVMQTARQNAEVLKTLKLHIGMGLSAETTEDNSLDLQIRIAEIEAEFQKMLKAIAADNVEAFDEEKAKALMDEKAKLQIQLDRIADTKQKRKNAKSRLDEIFTIIEALANHPISYDDQIVRQILESVIVESKEKIKVVFVGGLEVTQTM